MANTLLVIFTLTSALLVIYHHVGYPLILQALHRRQKTKKIKVQQRRYSTTKNDQSLPTISIVIPAYNEQQWIADKIRNLAILDYPSDNLKIIIVCDGCSDNTVNIAKQTARETECQHLSIQVKQYTYNRGKVAVINTVLQEIESDLVALSDVSTLVSVDALLIAAEQFKNPNIGVLNSHYQLLNPGSPGEATYWKYQSKLKTCEAALGSTLGTHGAFYLFRRSLFQHLEADTINDDFILPMEIVAKGYRAEQDNRIAALEMEQADNTIDQQRRRRIAAGNLQQLLRLRRLLLPQYGGIAFTFASGKGLRILMPFLMLETLIGSLLLTTSSLVFIAMAGIQVLIYTLAAWHLLFKPKTPNKYIQTIAYLVSGHMAGLIGTLRYLLGLEQGHWNSVSLGINQLPMEKKHEHSILHRPHNGKSKTTL